MMDAHQVKEWAQAGAAVLGSVKAAIKLLPPSPHKEEAERHLAQAEFEFKRAQADAARQFGFQICPRCWPPEIIVLGEGNKEVCRGCGKNPPEESGCFSAWQQ